MRIPTVAMAIAALLVAVLGGPGAAAQQPAAPAPAAGAVGDKAAAGPAIEFLAKNDWKWQSWKAGDPFICLTDAQGADVGCFSFYSFNGTKSMTVYGPGCKANERNGDCAAFPKPSRTALQRPIESVRFAITEEEAKRIVDLGSKWNARRFVLGSCDCTAFGNQVARLITDLKTPTASSEKTPVDFVRALKELNRSLSLND